MSSALVTGGAGFIGSHVCEALCERGWRVTVIDNFVTGSSDNLRGCPSVRLVEGDVNRPAVWRALARESFDVLYHYAATVGVRRTEEQPLCVLADVQGLRQAAAMARAGRVRKIVFASSSEVYGPAAAVPMTEETGTVGWSSYTTVKLYGEYLLQALWRVERIPTVSLRFFNVYGPRQQGSAYGFVVALFVQQALAGEPLTVFGDGTQSRDFVYVADNVRAALAAAERPEAAGWVVNVGTGRETKILELAQQVAAAVPERPPVAFMPARPVEVRRRCAATERLGQVLGMACSMTLAEGLEHLLREAAVSVCEEAARPQAALSVPAVP